MSRSMIGCWGTRNEVNSRSAAFYLSVYCDHHLLSLSRNCFYARITYMLDCDIRSDEQLHTRIPWVPFEPTHRLFT